MKIITIADLHLGKSSYDLHEYYKYELQSLIKELNNTTFDMLVILGDFTDRSIPSNSEAIMVYHAFILDLLTVCSNKNAQVRFLKGTRSHETNMFNHMISYLKIFPNFKVKTEISEETIDGFTFLYIPHIPVGTLDHLDGKRYDMVFGHGEVEGVSWYIDAKIKEGSYHMDKKCPLWTHDILHRLSDNSIFGHIHTETLVTKHIRYCGSYSTYDFSDTELKGYYEITLTKDDCIYKRINNPRSRMFSTENITNILNSNTDISSYVSQISLDNNRVRKRLLIDLPAIKEDNIHKVKYVKLMVDPRIKIKINTDVKETRIMELETRNEMIATMLDEATPMGELVKNYLKDTKDKEMSIETIIDILE